jgi:hypothetical protein
MTMPIETRCSCCGIVLPEDNRYYWIDEDGNDVLDQPLCCECAA